MAEKMKNPENVKIDVKDKKLLYQLSVDGRVSYTQLAKKVSLSKNAVKYRVDRLKNEGVIKNFASTINLGSLNLTTFTLLLKFNDDIYKNKEIIDYFRNYEFADWVITLSGDWDIFTEFVCKDFNHMFSIIEDIVKEFKETLNTYQVLFSRDTLRVEHLIADFYKDIKFPILPVKDRRIEPHKIDKIDRRILNTLAEDSSLTAPEIADKLNLTMDIVRYRMKNLINNSVIVKFFPEISLPKLGYTEYLYTVKLKNVSPEKIIKIKNEIKNNPNVTYAFFDKISFNLVFVCAFSSSEGIDTLSRGLRSEFSEIIHEQDYFIIKEQILFNLFPRGLINI